MHPVPPADEGSVGRTSPARRAERCRVASVYGWHDRYAKGSGVDAPESRGEHAAVPSMDACTTIGRRKISRGASLLSRLRHERLSKFGRKRGRVLDIAAALPN